MDESDKTKRSDINEKNRLKKVTYMGLLVALGIVFGDIGTSPLYVMKAIIHANPSYDEGYVIGAVSCIIWTLTIQTTLKYVIIALRADNKGEGAFLLYTRLSKMSNLNGFTWLRHLERQLL